MLTLDLKLHTKVVRTVLSSGGGERGAKYEKRDWDKSCLKGKGFILSSVSITFVSDSYPLTNQACGQYWGILAPGPGKVHTKMTEGQYSPVQLKLARLVNTVVYYMALGPYLF